MVASSAGFQEHLELAAVENLRERAVRTRSFLPFRGLGLT